MNNLLVSIGEKALHALVSVPDDLLGPLIPRHRSETVTREVTVSEVYTTKKLQVTATIKVTVNQI